MVAVEATATTGVLVTGVAACLSSLYCAVQRGKIHPRHRENQPVAESIHIIAHISKNDHVHNRHILSISVTVSNAPHTPHMEMTTEYSSF